MNESKIVYLGKGFGFLKVEGREKDLFFHAKGLEEGVDFNSLAVGDNVTYEDVIASEKGNAAVGVKLA